MFHFILNLKCNICNFTGDGLPYNVIHLSIRAIPLTLIGTDQKYERAEVQ